MSEDVLLSVRLPAELDRELESLAVATARSKSGLAGEAIAVYVREQAWQLARLEESIAQIEAGRGVPHEQVADWLRSWGRPDELPPPRCD